MAGPLAGVSVLDLTQNLAGPFATMMLADLGAEVLKVEPADRGDNARGFGPPFVRGESPGFLTLNRNKRAIALNLKDPQALDALVRLAERSDVLVENYRPGVTERLGIDYASLQERCPRLVYCSITGFGSTGPYADRGGLDLVAQGMSGIMSVTGEEDRPPVKVGVPITDLGAGMFAAIGILAALRHRDLTGEGQYLESCLLDAGLALSVWEASACLAAGEGPRRSGTAHRLSAPYEAFPTSDGMITVGAATQRLWERLCNVLGLEALLADPRFATNGDRVTNRRELAETIAQATRTHSSAELLEKLVAAEIPAGPILGYDEVLADAHAREHEMVLEQEHPTAGRVSVLGSPIKLSATPAEIDEPAPLLGQHTEEVLAELGYGGSEVAAMAERGACRLVHEAKGVAPVRP